MAVSGSCLAYITSPPSRVGVPVLVVHSWWGLTDSFITYADALAERGFVVGCADLFDGQVASTEAEARSLRSTRRREPAYRTLQQAIRELGSMGDGSVAVVGFSMGGHWAVWLAQHPDPPVSAVVLYYAARAGDFSTATAPVLAHYAETDRFVSGAARRTMERALSSHDLGYQAYDYPGTGHWFAESGSAAFDTGAADLALDRTTRFLRSVAQPG